MPTLRLREEDNLLLTACNIFFIFLRVLFSPLGIKERSTANSEMMMSALLLSLFVSGARGFCPVHQHHDRTSRLMSFEEALGCPLPSGVVESLASAGIVDPTPIQSACLGPLQRGDSGLLAAETGSGKSLAFLLPTMCRRGSEGVVVVLAPTRELALQLSTEATRLLKAWGEEGEVELLVVGSATTSGALKAAQCIVGTPKEMFETFAGRPALVRKLGTATSVVLDEVDALFPPIPRDRRSQASKDRSKKKKDPSRDPRNAAKNANEQQKSVQTLAASKFVSLLLKANPSPDLQVIGASATASRATRDALRRALRDDPYGRFNAIRDGVDEIEIFRPENVLDESSARSIVVPSVVQHMVASVEKGCSAKRAMKVAAEVVTEMQPKSTLLFLTKSSGLTVGSCCDALQEALGGEKRVAALHELLFEEREEEADREDRAKKLREGRLALADDVKNADAPILVTFEDSARGLHFDNVDLVMVLGLPNSPSSYLHLAGRTGRRSGGDEVSPGAVVTLIPDKASAVLRSWSKQLGGVDFGRLKSDAGGKEGVAA